MLDRFLHLSEYVSRVLFKCQLDKSTKSKPPQMVTATELEALREVKALLKPLANVTAEVSTEKTVSISKVIPLTNFIKTKANEFYATTSIGKRVKKILCDGMDQKFANIERNPLYAAATLVDPRFKKVAFESPSALKAAETEVGRLVCAALAESRATNRAAYEATIEEQDVDEANVNSDQDDDYPWASIDKQVRVSNQKADSDRVGGLPVELRQFLNRPPVDRKSNPNPLKAWQTLKGEQPHVWRVAVQLLSTVATSVPCERLFPHAGIIANQLRSHLSGPHLDMLVFLRNVTPEEWFNGFVKAHSPS
ncbi:Zinc finger BED domain-containing protein 4 [Frankliniella fusca]|uniref:Zinc finger BED domain-containing protein 4 n=1 Tax=Frankliniella fusca TaxID=407009 RepID=A0AAE1GYS9_9NEOP|nr:Zinc finger BED domain-containing protein 4 [Frankliniella fusca]